MRVINFMKTSGKFTKSCRIDIEMVINRFHRVLLVEKFARILQENRDAHVLTRLSSRRWRRSVIPSILINIQTNRFLIRRDLCRTKSLDRDARTNGDDLIKFIVNARRVRTRNVHVRYFLAGMRLIKIHSSRKSRSISGFCNGGNTRRRRWIWTSLFEVHSNVHLSLSPSVS